MQEACLQIFTVFVIDQRNHGKSPHHDDWDYDVMAEDLYEFLVTHGIHQTNILGHSMGGKTAMQFAAWYPEQILKLIILDIGPKHYSPHHTEIIKGLTELPLQQIKNRSQADSILNRHIPDTSIRQFLLKSLKREGDNGFKWKFNLDAIRKNYTKILQSPDFPDEINLDCLFLNGQLSDYLVPEDREHIRSIFTNASFKTIQGAGHWVHAEKPTAFLEATNQFLQ